MSCASSRSGICGTSLRWLAGICRALPSWPGWIAPISFALVAVLAWTPPSYAQSCAVVLSWEQPTQNVDGSPLTNLAGYRVFWGSSLGQYPNSTSITGSAIGYTITGLAGDVYAVVSTVNGLGVVSQYSNAAHKACGSVPQPPQIPPTPTAVPAVACVPAYQCGAPPVAIAVTMSNFQPDNSPEFDLAITGSGAVSIALGADHVFDWCTTGAPQLGGNGGATAKSVAFQAPLSTRCDADGAQPFAGGTVTVGAAIKPLVKSGTTWTASIP